MLCCYWCWWKLFRSAAFMHANEVSAFTESTSGKESDAVAFTSDSIAGSDKGKSEEDSQQFYCCCKAHAGVSNFVWKWTFPALSRYSASVEERGGVVKVQNPLTTYLDNSDSRMIKNVDTCWVEWEANISSKGEWQSGGSQSDLRKVNNLCVSNKKKVDHLQMSDIKTVQYPWMND